MHHVAIIRPVFQQPLKWGIFWLWLLAQKGCSQGSEELRVLWDCKPLAQIKNKKKPHNPHKLAILSIRLSKHHTCTHMQSFLASFSLVAAGLLTSFATAEQRYKLTG